MNHDREQLAATFDHAADSYDRARPDYPESIFDLILGATGVKAGDEVLEIGAGTGKATRPLAARGLHVTCLEPGPRLAVEARRRLNHLPHVRVVQSSFEEWRPAERRQFRLVVSATSWHWLDPHVRYRRAWELLAPGGHLAFWSALHVVPSGGDPFFSEIQDVYVAIGAATRDDAPAPPAGGLPDMTEEIVATGLFEPIPVEQFDWEVTYDAEGYIDLLRTFSSHLAMNETQRTTLFDEIRRRLALRPDGLVRRHWGAAVHVARALPASETRRASSL
jgi:SAM-dependent methyltransferase